MLLLSGLLSSASALNISVGSSEVSVTGSGSSTSTITVGWDSKVFPTFLFLFQQSGSTDPFPTGTDAIGVVNDQTGVFLVTKATGTTTLSKVGTTAAAAYDASLNKYDIALTNVNALLAASGVSYSFGGTRTYPVCMYGNVNLSAAIGNSKQQKGCGAVHLYAADATYASTTIDRNVGNYITSDVIAADTTSNASRSGNAYNVTLYGSLNGNFVTGTLNCAVIAYTTTGSNLFKFWWGVGVGQNKMINQDIVAQNIDKIMNDYYSSAASIAGVVLDTSKSGCSSDITVISYGSGSTYQYGHFSRKLITGDISCDTSIITNSTTVCLSAFEGASTITGWTAQHQLSGKCAVFTFGGYLVSVLVGLIVLAL